MIVEVLIFLVAVIVIAAIFLLLYTKWIDSYWEKRGIYTYRAHNENEYIILETYKTLKAKGLKHGAFVRFYRPFFMTTDLDEIKAILKKDADHFINRGMYSNPKADPMSATLARLENQDWKNVRSIVSPIFSSGKMKKFFPDIASHAKTLQDAVAPYADANVPFDAKDVAKKFGMDSMGSCTFGFEINTLKGQNKDFQELVNHRMKLNRKIIAEYVVNWKLLKMIRFKTSDPKLDHYVQRIISDTCEYRAKNGIQRNDIFKFVQELTDKDIDETELVKNNKISNSQMIRLLQTFFIGGFETSSNLTSFALLELALNQGIQDKLRENICECLNKHHDFTYDAVMEMDYLDWVICGKMKKFFPDIASHAKTLQDAVAPYADANVPFDAKDVAKKFGMDSMGSCTFGFEINTLKGQNKDFQELVNHRMKLNRKIIAEYVVNWKLLKMIRFKTSDPKLDHYVQRIISDTCEYRAKNGIQRNDIFKFVQELTDKDIDETELVKNNKISNSQMIRLLQTFFIGGFETSSNLTSFALLELALNQGIQDKLRENICECLNKHHDFTYDAVMEMDYLDWVICESLRKYPPGQSIHRYCNKTYKIPNSDISIYPGEFISIPTIGIHNDPDYYPDPEQFQPERFSPENKAKRHPMTFLPFGAGPRNCIGARLGQILSKVAVVAIISKFRITLNSRTTTPIIFEKKSMLLDVNGGVWLNCSKI